MNPLQPLIDEVTRAKGLSASLIALHRGEQERINAAIATALAGGATGQQVADAVGVVLTEFKTSNDEIAAALAANP